MIVSNNVERFQIVLNVVVWRIVRVNQRPHFQTVLISG